MSSAKYGKILLLILLVAGCSQFRPYVDRRREAGVQDISQLYVGASKPDKPAICYNLLTASYDEVKALADNECKKQETGTRAEPVKQTVFTCKIFTPNHFYFKCVK